MIHVFKVNNKNVIKSFNVLKNVLYINLTYILNQLTARINLTTSLKCCI